MKQSDTLISKMRLTAIYNECFILRTREVNKLMMRKYRARDRTIWSEEEKTSAKIFYSKKCEEEDDWDNDEDFAQNQLTWDEIK